ncbi:MAG: RNA 2',3'-cyclic phosphodiesterase [Desulfobacteraceae bacterium]
MNMTNTDHSTLSGSDHSLERPLIRTFIAVPLPEIIIVFLSKLQEEIKQKKIKASLTKVKTMHLTLKFLGDTPAEAIDRIKEVIRITGERNSSVSLGAGGIGVFPSVKKARVIFSGVKGETDRLENLHKELDQQLSVLGFPRERKRFSPHLTLARIKKRQDPLKLIRLIKENQDQKTESFTAKTICLFKSELNPAGAVHTKLFEQKLDTGRNSK